jgi:hypothetical protein
VIPEIVLQFISCANYIAEYVKKTICEVSGIKSGTLNSRINFGNLLFRNGLHVSGLDELYRKDITPSLVILLDNF